MLCGVKGGWHWVESRKANKNQYRGSDIDFKITRCALGYPVRKVRMKPGSVVTESSPGGVRLRFPLPVTS